MSQQRAILTNTMRRFGFLVGTATNLVLIGLTLAYGIGHWSSAGRASMGASPTRAVWELLSFALLCGLATFTTIEAFKRLLGLRGYYQARQTRLWLARRAQDAVWNPERLGDSERVADHLEKAEFLGFHAWIQMLDTMGVEHDSITRTFNLPNEQLAALVSSAADAALSSGRGAAFPAALARVPPQVIEDASHAMRVRSRDSIEPTYAALVTQRVHSGVDQLQISLGGRWRRYVQSAAVWIAGAYGIALAHGRGFRVVDAGHLVLVAVIIGGPLAWVLRDVDAVVERNRR